MTVDFLPQKDTLEREQKEISIKEDELISRLVSCVIYALFIKSINAHPTNLRIKCIPSADSKPGRMGFGGGKGIPV